MNAHDWLQLATLALGGGGGMRLLAKLGQLVNKIEEVGRSNREIARAHRRLVNRVNDHEARLISRGL